MKTTRLLLLLPLLCAVLPVMAQWTTSGNDIYNSNTGNVGIGTTTPGYKLDVNGTARFLNTVTVPSLKFDDLTNNTTTFGSYLTMTLPTGNFFRLKTTSASITTSAALSNYSLFKVADLSTLVSSNATQFGIIDNRPTFDMSAGSTSFYGYRFKPTITGTGSTGKVWAFYADKGSNYFGDNVLVGTTTDNGYKLDVNGNFNFSSDGMINGMKIGKGLGDLSSNSVFGINSGRNISTGNYNTFIGSYTGGLVTTGGFNTLVGSDAGYVLSTGAENTIVGARAGYSLTTGGNNTLLGSFAGNVISTGSNNTYLGHYAGSGSLTAVYNTGIGAEALKGLTSGNNNTGIGHRAGRFYGSTGTNSNTTSSNSVYLGYETRASADNNTNETVIGYAATGNGSNSVTIGNNSVTKTVLQGSVGIGTASPTAKFHVNGTSKFTDQLQLTKTTDNAGIPAYLAGYSTGARVDYTITGAITTPNYHSAQHNLLQFGAYGGNVTSYSAAATRSDLFLNDMVSTLPGGNYFSASESFVTIVGNTNIGGGGVASVRAAATINATTSKYYGVLIDQVNGNGTITDKYGLYQLDATSKNYFAGKVTIGTTTDAGYKLDVNGATRLNNSLVVNADGTVALGTITTYPSGYKLAVAGNIIAEKVRVKLQSSTWPDYVFDKKYKLPSLQEIEQFIQEHQHLPGVPSAAEVEKEGIDLGNNQVILLKKIEELTLHLIELNKKVDQLVAENETLKKKQQEQ